MPPPTKLTKPNSTGRVKEILSALMCSFAMKRVPGSLHPTCTTTGKSWSAAAAQILSNSGALSIREPTVPSVISATRTVALDARDFLYRQFGRSHRQHRGPSQPLGLGAALSDPAVVAHLQRALEVVIARERRAEQRRVDDLHVDTRIVESAQPLRHVHQGLMADAVSLALRMDRGERRADLNRPRSPGPVHRPSVDQPEGVVDSHVGRLLGRDGDRDWPPAPVFAWQEVPGLLDLVNVRVRIDKADR